MASTKDDGKRKPVTGTNFEEMFPENRSVRRSGLSPVLRQ
jgi:hypothetical protein